MNKFYIDTIAEIQAYNKKLEQLNDGIMDTNSLTTIYCYKAQIAELESKKYKDITVLLTLGYSILQIEKDIDDLYEEAN